MSPSERSLFAGLQTGAQLGGTALSATKAATKKPMVEDSDSFLTGLAQGVKMGPQGGAEAPMLAMQPQQQQMLLPQQQPMQQLGDGTDLRRQLLIDSFLKNTKL